MTTMALIDVRISARFATIFVVASILAPEAASQENPLSKRSPTTSTGSKEERRAAQKRHQEQSEALLRGGKHPEAIAEIQAAMDIEREIAGPASSTMALLLRHLATIREDQDDITAAREALIQVVEVERAIHGEQHSHVTDAQWEVRHFQALETLTRDQRATLDLPPELMEGSVAGVRKRLMLHRRLLGDRDPRFAQILFDMAKSLSQQGNLFAARLWGERCLTARKELLGDRHPSTVDSLWQLGILRHHLGEIVDARASLERVLELFKTTSGADDARHSGILDSLSRVLKDQGDLDGALARAKQAHELTLGVNGPDDARTVELEVWLAELLRLKQDFAAAHALLLHAVAFYGQRQNPRPRDPPYFGGTWAGAFAVAQSELARLYLDRRDSEAAMKLVAEIRGRQRPMEAMMSNRESTQVEANLAWVARMDEDKRRREVRRLAAEARSLRFQGRPAEAEQILEAWIKLLSASPGDDSDDVVIPLGELARLYLQQSNFIGARRAQERQKQVIESLLTEEHHQTADARLALEHINRLAGLEPGPRRRLEASHEARDEAMLLAAEGQFVEEAAARRKIAADQIDVLGEKDPEVIDRIFELALAEQDADETAQAIASLRRALQLNREVRGPRHPEVFRCLAQLAGALDAHGDRDAARRVLLEAGPLKNRRPPPAGKTTLRILYHPNNRVADVTGGEEVLQAARLDSDLRRPRDISAVEALLAVERRLLSEQPLAPLASLIWLAERHEARGQYDDAIARRREICETWSKIGGPGNWRTIDSQADLDYVDRLAKLGLDDRFTLESVRHVERQLTVNLKLGNYDDALGYLHWILVHERRLFGERHPRSITRLESLGQMLEKQGQFDTALLVLGWVVELRRETAGERHPAFAQALWWHANVLLDQGHSDRAEPQLQKAIQILTEQIGPQHLATISCLSDWGRALLDQGRYEEARTVLERSAEVFRRALGEKHPNTFGVLDKLAMLYRTQGDFSAAVGLYETMSAQNVVSFGRNQEQSSRAAQFAALLGRMGQYARAKIILERLLSSTTDREVLRGPRLPGGRQRDDVGDGTATPAFAEQQEILAELLLELGDRDRALRLAQQSLDLTEEILGRDHPSYAKRQSLLAVVLRSRGQLDKAEALATDAVQRLRRVQKAVHPELASVLARLAAVHTAKGNTDQAIALYEEALSLRERLKGESHPDYIRDLNDLAEALMARIEFARAAAVVSKARRYAEGQRDLDPITTARGLHNAARIRANEGDRLEARRLSLRALELRESHLARNLHGLGERERLVLVASARRPFFEVLDLLKGDAELDRTSYAHVIVWKGIATATSRSEARGRLLRQAGADNVLSTQVGNLNAVLRSLTELVYARSTGERDPTREAFREHLRRDPTISMSLLRFHRQRHDSPASVLGDVLGEFGVTELRVAEKLGPMPEAPTPEQVSSSLPERAVLLDLLRYTREDGELRYVAFVVRRHAGPVRIELGTSAPIDQVARRWREAIERRGDVAGLALEMSRLLWAPLARWCEGATTVLLSADGELNSVPWSALPDLGPGARTGAYLIERHAFACIGSVRQLLEHNSGEPTGTGLLAIGGVDYGRRDHSLELPSWAAASSRVDSGKTIVKRSMPMVPELLVVPSLKGTLAEVEALQLLYARAMATGGPVTALSGPAATKERVVGALPGKRYIHLATHGFFAPPRLVEALSFEDRLPRARSAGDCLRLDAVTYYPGVLSGLIWAGVNAPDSTLGGEYLNWGGNVLTAEEVRGLDLSGCELAVLSACETSLGRQAGGEGVLGLQRAFHAAGARAVVASLWKVEDAATSALMERFYANFWVKKLPKLEALRQAQLAVLNDPGMVQARRVELAQRGIGETAVKLPEGGRVAAPSPGDARSDPSLWAAFVLSGDGR
jgi:CHAT domain-containing protein/tetratricopeptide (TPR) repeat protein